MRYEANNIIYSYLEKCLLSSLNKLVRFFFRFSSAISCASSFIFFLLKQFFSFSFLMLFPFNFMVGCCLKFSHLISSVKPTKTIDKRGNLKISNRRRRQKMKRKDRKGVRETLKSVRPKQISQRLVKINPLLLGLEKP